MRAKFPYQRALVGLIAAGLFLAPVLSQSPGVAPPDSNVVVNRYLQLYEYFTGNRIGRFNVINVAGDPKTLIDDDAGLFNKTIDLNGSVTNRPHGNSILFRIEDTDLAAPEFVDWFDGDFTGGTGLIVLVQANNSEFRSFNQFIDPVGVDLEFVHRVQLIRDLVRDEFTVTNTGSGSTSVGLQYSLWPEPVIASADPAIYIDQIRRIRKPTFLTLGDRPTEILFVEDPKQTTDIYVAKSLVRGFDTTQPDETLINAASRTNADNFDWTGNGNIVNWGPPPINPNADLLSGLPMARHTWMPRPIGPNQQLRFIQYMGVGAASHGMSNAFVLAHRQNRPDDSQGYVAAVETPPTLGLVNGFVNGAGTDFDVDVFMQNAYLNTLIGNASALLQPSPAFVFSPTAGTQSSILPLGTLQPLNRGNDEGSGKWVLRPTGLEAGLVTIRVNFNNSFGDAIQVLRKIRVPQGRRYQLAETYQMMTFPFTFSGVLDDPATVLGLAPGSFQVFEYDTRQGAYVRAQQIIPGRGYWVRTVGLGGQVVDLGGGAQPIKLDRQTVTTEVVPGWNLLGSPSPYSIAVRDLRFLLSGGELVNYAEAVARKVIRPTVFEYDPVNNVYVSRADQSLINPGKGIWLFARTDLQVIWPESPWHGMSIVP